MNYCQCCAEPWLRKSVLTVVAALAVVLGSGVWAEDPLTNDDVVRLAKAGLDATIIISKIESSETAFDTSTDALVKLADSGVANEVISAMMVAAEEGKTRRAEAKRKAAEEAVRRKAEEKAQRKAEAARRKAEAARRMADERVRRKGEREHGTAEEVARRWPPGKLFREPLRSGGEGPQMVVLPAGNFRMGCLSNDDVCRDYEKPVHEVRIARPFAVSVYEVTFEEYDRFTASTGRGRADDEGWGRGRRPVINVSWLDAQAYVSWLSEQTGAEYRLLSESEWEYAARAGSSTKYSWGDEIGRNRANCGGDRCGDQWEYTAPVGSFEPNGFGLYDMHGNVWEWVADCWNKDYQGAPTDGSAWTWSDCENRVLRGGSWSSSPGYLRSASRLRSSTVFRYYFLGFRVVRTLTP